MIFAAKRLGRLEDALETLSAKLEQLEHDRNAHLLELDEMYEKLQRLYGRTVKRQQRATQEEPQEEPSEQPCADPITAKVMAFREARGHVLGQQTG